MELETYTSLRATPELIGRGSILKDIHTAILKKERTPQVFYITAWGGWGKTRLLIYSDFQLRIHIVLMIKLT